MTSPEPAAAVVETHISYVFAIGDRVYKLKKPVRYSFIDQSTRELRERACHREVELNRRLAPDVYLGVLDIVEDDGRPVDHLVEMRRLPDDRRLSTLVAAGTDVDPCLRQLARDLASFHAGAVTSDEICSFATARAARGRFETNLAEVERFVGPVLDATARDSVAALVDRYVDGRDVLFSARATPRHARDGHGDLLADDIFCLDDGPRALDCIEFDDHLRWGDVLADVAFLAMDLERLGARDLSDRFLAWYREFSGETFPSSLADFYVAYRASIRAKVACLKHEQGDEPSADRARALFDLCRRRLERGRMRLVLVGGLPGVGKSTLASGLSARAGWALLRSDEIRKDVTGTPHMSHGTHDVGGGIYAAEPTRRTYDEMLGRARVLLRHGESVILDASWMDAGERDRAASLARETSSELVAVRCVLDASVAVERMRHRHAIGTDPSDADARVAAAMAARFDPWPDAVDVTTDAAPDQVTDAACRALGVDESERPAG
jgi:hypothetical protein